MFWWLYHSTHPDGYLQRPLIIWLQVIFAWWRHQMETFPRYWPFVRGIHRSQVSSPHKGQRRRALMFFYDLCPNKRLSKQSWCWWFETRKHSLWRHCNGFRLNNFQWIPRKFILCSRLNRWHGLISAYYSHSLVSDRNSQSPPQSFYCNFFMYCALDFWRFCIRQWLKHQFYMIPH